MTYASLSWKLFLVPLLIAVILFVHVFVAFFPSQPSRPFSATSPTTTSSKVCPLTSSQQLFTAPIRTADDVRLLLQANVHVLTYVPRLDLLLMTMPKAGTRTIWHVLYRGLTNKTFRSNLCGIVHRRDSPCWKGLLQPFEHLPISKQLSILSSPNTLRMGVQREPFSRLISAFKSKFTCDFAKFHDTSFNNTAHTGSHSSFLRKAALLPPSTDCMSLDAFADALDRIRTNIGNEGFPKSRWNVDGHIRPQEFHVRGVDYNLLLDTHEMSNATLMKPLFDRLPFPDMARSDTHVSSSGDDKLVMDEGTAMKLHRFAALSNYHEPIHDAALS